MEWILHGWKWVKRMFIEVDHIPFSAGGQRACRIRFQLLYWL